ncbi:MAG: ATP-binding protein [Candidatus Asgardarchaeia archaeon]
MSEGDNSVGVILSGSTTSEALCQLRESAERGKIKEGMFLVIKDENRAILTRVSQIIPYNEFFTEGDPWSESRRKGYAIPEDVARRYEICRLELLMEIRKIGNGQEKYERSDIRTPPQPGDLVFKIDAKLHENYIFGVSKGTSNHVWIGTLYGYEDLPIPLNVENIPMHMAIFGVTGSGKSYTAGALIEKLSKIPVKRSFISYPMVIIDYHGDYIDYVRYVESGKKLGEVGWIKRYVFPNSRLIRSRLKNKYVEPIGINLDLIPIRDLAESIILFYKGRLEGSELHLSGLANILESITGGGYSSAHNLIEMDLKYLESEIDKADKSIIHSQTKDAIKRALNQFFDVIEEKYHLLSTESDLRDEKFVEKLTKEGGVAIFDFSADGAPGVDLKTKQFVMNYLATLLFEKFTQYKMKGEDRYLLFLIEEAQNFCPDRSYPIESNLAHKKLSAIATQGRKFGLSLCLITQRPSFVDRIVLSMCNTFFIHRVSPEDVNFIKLVTGGLPRSLMSKLTVMKRGDLIVTGQMIPTEFPLMVHISEKDRKVEHTIGRTEVCMNIARLRGVL